MTMWKKIDKNAPSARADFVRVWMNNLYYGDYKQNNDGKLLREKHGVKEFCCLGLAEQQAGRKPQKTAQGLLSITVYCFGKERNTTFLTSPLQGFLKLQPYGGFKPYRQVAAPIVEITNFIKSISDKPHRVSRYTCDSLARMNDNQQPFTVIALVIRKYAEYLFSDLTEAEIQYIRDTKLDGNHKENQNG